MTDPVTSPLTAQSLLFELTAAEPILLHAHNGSALRGMLYRAAVELAADEPLRPGLDFRPDDPILLNLLATLDEGGARGQEAPRPYVVEPPVTDGERPAGRLLEPGASFSFGVTLFGSAMDAFPVLVMALKRAEAGGIGRFLGADARSGRGRFRLTRVVARNPLTRMTQEILAPGERRVMAPHVVITQGDVATQASLDAEGHPSRLRIYFHTPTTLKARGEVVRFPAFNVLIHRLIERLDQLTAHHGRPPLACLPDSREARNALLRQADAIALNADATRWVDLRGYSDRTRAPTNLGGIAGIADYTGSDFAPFFEILRWGELAHVGQNAVKGNGLFRIQRLD